ncbi:1-acylglycerol-3-phosphate O-acyltransferase [Orbilia oligospora]|uniref:1-acyl-sn-glycerol-3-phosphate acyltransferase n=2 Tax=Orbilia oligospora TaxID=2813651 RepID=A0A6G1LTV3_ORBOL|nr:1-acylglycerol-3-phosphate O-acyltransferase [Orbilia oligospora]KAF3233508.1 1-acylglycerol-3-phosphate O-acyltransferase [Orbilia oligospora]
MFYYLTIFMAVYALLTLTLTLLGTVSKLAAFASKLLIAYMIMCFCALYGVAAAIVLTPFGKNVAITQWTVGRVFRWTLGPALGVEFEVENEEGMWKDRPVVFVGNHQSELDLLVLGRIFPQYCSVSAKSSLKHTPFLGWFMQASGAIFIDRANRTSALSAFDNAIKQMKSNGQSAWIFPEGTRSYTTETMMLPFKKGAFHLAVQAQVPIVPVVIQNYSHVLNLKDKTFRPGTIRVKILDKVETEGLEGTKEEVDKLVEKVRDSMVKELEGMGLGDRKKSQ